VAAPSGRVLSLDEEPPEEMGQPSGGPAEAQWSERLRRGWTGVYESAHWMAAVVDFSSSPEAFCGGAGGLANLRVLPSIKEIERDRGCRGADRRVLSRIFLHSGAATPGMKYARSRFVHWPEGNPLSPSGAPDGGNVLSLARGPGAVMAIFDRAVNSRGTTGSRGLSAQE